MCVQRLSFRRRAATAARWPVGIGLTWWRYLWRITPMHRTELTADPARVAPPALPADVDRGDVQTADDGVGAVFHRVYRVRIADSCPPRQLIEAVRDNPDTFA